MPDERHRRRTVLPGSAHHGRRDTRWALALVLLVAWALRAPLLNGPRFHPDEALFASYARSIAVWRDPWLADAAVDKPPLLFYLQALCYPFLGAREMAARLPNLFASLSTVALTCALMAGMVRDPAASRGQPSHLPGGSQVEGPRLRIACLVASLVVALSPLAVSFSATAFTDPLMVMLATASLLAAVTGAFGWSGFWLGAGLATKYQAALFLPLAVGMLATAGWRREGGDSRQSVLRWARWLAGLLIPVAAMLVWEWARTGRLTLLADQWRSYGGLRPAPFCDWFPRLAEWLKMARWVTGSTLVSLLVLAAVLGWAVSRVVRGPRNRLGVCGLLLVGWLSGYGLVHWLLDVPVWDRYLLPAVPVTAVLAGWLVARLPAPRRVARWLVLLGTLALMLPGSVAAATGDLPLGGDRGLLAGIDQVAVFFADHPYGTVLYDHWLSWELRYYLFESRVYVSWFTDSQTLGADLRVFGADPPRYLIIPSWEPAEHVVAEVRATGFAAEKVFEAFRPDGTVCFRIWEISDGVTGA